MADGKAVTTVEGLAKGGELDPVQKGFMECHGLQCGYCTPGMMMTAPRAARPQPASRPRRRSAKAISGNICRCTGYKNIVAAIQWAADNPATQDATQRGDRMTAVEDAPLSAAGNPIGFGRMHRKEDVRFLRGEGNYVDDVAAARACCTARSCAARTRTRGSSPSTPRPPRRCPGVKAVITGAVLETLGLAWMPTLSYDTQAVLATDKVRFQGQEVAFVVAESRYIARDALELIDVDYEPLPAVVDAKKALDPDAPIIRDDKEGKTDNHIYDWEAGNKAETDAAFAGAEVVVTEDILYPRVHPAPMETCGSVAHMDPVTGQAHALDRPRRRRTRTARSTRSSPVCPSRRSR